MPFVVCDKYRCMKFTLLVSLLSITTCCIYAQFPFPLPVSKNGKENVLIIYNEQTGMADTVKVGAFIKLWFWSARKRNIEQPIYRSDFRRHTYYIESNLMGITDTTLVFLKRPPFIPLPLPIKIPARDFDTVKLSEIRSIRVVNRNLDGAAKGAVMMPAMSVMPSYFTTFPGMLLIMPSMNLINTYAGDVMFPYRRVNKDSINRFSLRVGEIPADTLYYIHKRKMTNPDDYEWEIERLERYEKMYAHVKQELSDQILDTYLGNKVLNFTLGVTLIPNVFKSGDDVKTRISITERKIYFGFASENYISERHRLGLEIQMNKTERFMSVTGSSSQSISASSGMILSNFSYFKYGLGGLYSRQYKARKWADISELDERIAKETDEIESGNLSAQRTLLKDLIAMEPRPYLLLGIGAVNTTLIKIKGSMANGISATDYSQQKFAVEGGMGITTRLGKRLLYDLSAKYIWSPGYSPAIGGLERYSGFRLQVNIGYMSGPSFARCRRLLREVNRRRD
ncbi:hypothetical protein SAMN04488121_101260 [Chitinophaga filiformis]|uniref:Outer membrane protein beta-barrel domain-containing protein n=2 Tax=Chitinophaga filiformis TaxID=104663 RepID=A0A1G7H175_CHIFI|nr:hypothetical protein SAMN04488121_101260 [Chitinophaga filiformis]